MANIRFNYLQQVSWLRERERLKEFILWIIKKEKHHLEEIQFIFCSDDYLLKINQQFLSHDYYTDIITFPFNKRGEAILAEIYISIDRVKENAIALNVNAQRELSRVIFHGVLHLCGYKDKLKTEKELMRAKEEFYLKRYYS